MTDNSKPNPVVQMLRVIQQQTLERLQRGELNADRDLKNLFHHLELSRELGDQQLIGELQCVIGLVYNATGHLEEAGNYWVQANRSFEVVQHIGWQAQVQNYLGELYYHLGNSDAALEAYQDARQLAEEAADNTAIMRIEGNLGLLWLQRSEIDKAFICFSLVIAVTESESWQHIYSLVNARRGLAEVYIQRKDFPASWQEANEAEQLAIGRQLKLPLALTQLTKAHIAAADPSTPGAAEYYYTMGLKTLREYGNPIMLARTLMEEARYFRYNHKPEDAQKCAAEAHQIFLNLNLSHEAELVTEFLADLNAADN